MRNNLRRHKPSWTIVTAVILGGALVFTIFTKNTSSVHMAYDASNTVSVDTGGSSQEEIPETYNFRSSLYGFSLDMPVTWRQYEDEHVIYLVDHESSASMKITGENYYPSVNNDSAESVSQEIIDSGFTFLNFSRVSENHNEVIYQDKGNTTYDYIDEIYWTRSDILTVSCIFEDSDYEQVIDDYELIIDSLNWENENSIPDGYALYYSDLGSYEIGVPSSWTVGTGDGYIVASDTVNGSSLTATAEESQDNLEEMTSLDITAQLNQGQSNFMLQSFSGDEKEAYAAARYLSGEEWICMKEKLIANGQYWYTIVLQYPEDVLTDENWDMITDLFRSFL